MYFHAFWILDTERPIAGSAMGRIPWSKVRQYGKDVLGFEPCMLDVLWTITSTIDLGYLAWQKEQFKKASAQDSPKKVPKVVRPQRSGRRAKRRR